MGASCIRQTDLPNATKLYSDFLYHPDRVSRFYPYLPLSIESFRAAAASVCFSPESRKALLDALSIQNAGNPLLEKLARPGAVAIVTGQQVGLFTGPAFTLYKALTAIRLAEHLTGHGIDAVPIFWLATEDHDLAEIDHAWVFDRSRRPVKLKTEAASGPNHPAGCVAVPNPPLAELKHALAGLPYASGAIQLAQESYTSSATFGSGFAALLDRLLPMPILRVDPMLPAFRQLAAPLLRQAVERSPELSSAVMARSSDLTGAGYHAQVHWETSTSFVFLLEECKRTALRRSGNEFLAGSHRIPAAELAARAAELSPNALLRPVVQDSMLPTLAYVGGPAEIAYLAQSEVLYRNLLGRQPIAIPRASITILDARTKKLLDRYNLTLPDLLQSTGSLQEKAGSVLAHPDLLVRIESARQSAVDSLDRMSREIAGFDPSIDKALDTSRRKIAYQFEKISRKTAREALRRNQRAQQEIESLQGFLFPQRHMQERLYSSLAFIAEFGPGFAERIYPHVNFDCPDHRIVSI